MAVLIAFLALTAYNEVRNRLAKGRSRRKDLESPASPKIAATQTVEQPNEKNDVEDVNAPSKDTAAWKEMESHKQLYFKLHNLEHYPEILPECHHLLLSLLSETISDALNEHGSTILSVPTFSRDSLSNFLKTKDINVTDRYEEYVARRKAGGRREMFSDKEEGKWWLKQASPVKYVDGSWLGHINKISTPFKYRHITKNAWQVMSEELGDGDLAKNHVHVYRELMKDIDAGLPEADSQDFISPRHELNEARCWKAAMAQLLISLFSHDFLPEALGFNMAYESLPLHLLKTVKELRELRLNPYYFELHISIDNADSGHAAMAMETVADYIELIAREEGEEVAHVAWKRVQAGYILAEGLPTTPESPSLKQAKEEPFPRSETEAALLDIFAAKSPVAHKIHCNSRLKIGRRTLVDWLEPNAFRDSQWQKDFLHDLGNCKPWVIKGNSEKSRLVRELSWEGKMFGSFTQTEVATVKAWIDELGAPVRTPQAGPSVYLDFVGKPKDMFSLPRSEDIFVDYPVITNTMSEPTGLDPHSSSVTLLTSLTLDTKKLNLKRFLPLWFTSLALLESLPSVPVRAADTFGSALVRVLRAQTGFSDEGPGVAGMEEVKRTEDGQAIGIVELGLEMCRRAGLGSPKTLKEIMELGDMGVRDFGTWIMDTGMRWMQHRDFLIGMAWVFVEVHFLVTDSELLDEDSRQVLKSIAQREQRGLEVCKLEIEEDEQRRAEFWKGVGIARSELRKCHEA